LNNVVEASCASIVGRLDVTLDKLGRGGSPAQSRRPQSILRRNAVCTSLLQHRVRRYVVNKAVQFVTLLLFSLVTGVFWGTWFSLSRSMSEITPPTFLEVGHLMIGNLGGPMRVLMPAALLSALVLSVLLSRARHTGASLFASIALVLMASALVITLVVNVPIDRQI